MGLSKIADAMSGESEYDCPSCEQTLALESFGEYECRNFYFYTQNQHQLYKLQVQHHTEFMMQIQSFKPIV